MQMSFREMTFLQLKASFPGLPRLGTRLLDKHMTYSSADNVGIEDQ